VSAPVNYANNQSYRGCVARQARGRSPTGDLLANIGTGMLIVAMPVQTLSIHGNIRKANAIGLV
jgi:hypothetical protein